MPPSVGGAHRSRSRTTRPRDRGPAPTNEPVPQRRLRTGLEPWLLPFTAAGLGVGLVALVAGAGPIADVCFTAATVTALAVAVVDVITAIRERRPGVDIIAAVAMAGALALGETLAGAVLAVMLTGGQWLERSAAGRARRELTALLEQAPRQAHRETSGALIDIPAGDVVAGDALVVKAGEVVPADGLLLSSTAVLDESTLTGESRPTELSAGALVRSGAVNAGAALRLRATASASDSTFAGIVRLVEQAAAERAPFVRMADRYAVRFVGVTFVLASLAWAVSGDPVRALAVIVVATPCPLILAAPAAIVGGLSAAARRGIIVKGGGALEALAGAQFVLLDKTGTLTAGRPRVTRVQPVAEMDADALLWAAAAVEQFSHHPFAPAVVAAAVTGAVDLPLPTEVQETPGSGIVGRVAGREVRVGRLEFVAPGAHLPSELRTVRRSSGLQGSSVVYVAIDGDLAGAVVLEDPVRPEAPRSLRRLRTAGIEHITMVTGDRLEVAELIGDVVGVDTVLAELTPAAKVDAVREARQRGVTVVAGDGINDAPALALADVGVAMGARGATAASEAADVVLTVDRLEGLSEATRIARRTRRVARQSVLAGMGMSIVAMGAAAAGLLPPVAGALVQEVIDLLVIGNALRAVTGGRRPRRAATPPAALPDLLEAHANHGFQLDELDRLATELDVLPWPQVHRRALAVRDYLRDELLPHELEEERELYPAVVAALPREDPSAPLVRTHREIARMTRLFERLVDELDPDLAEDADRLDLQRMLWALHGILVLHFALEDELYAELRAR